MGRENPMEQFDQHAIDAMSLLLSDASKTLTQLLEQMKSRNVTQIMVRHLAKGAKAARESQEFAAMAKQCFIDHVSGNALAKPKRSKPTAEEVSSEITKRRIAKGIDPNE